MIRLRMAFLFLVPLVILVLAGGVLVKLSTGFPALPVRMEAFIAESGVTRFLPERVAERVKLKMFELVRRLQARQDRLDAEVEAESDAGGVTTRRRGPAPAVRNPSIPGRDR